MSFEFGDVVLVPFPFSHQAAVKKRPAVVVSNAAYNRGRPDVVIMAITSQVGTSFGLGDLLIADWAGAGLLKVSAVKPVFATLEQALVIRQLGAFAAQDKLALRACIADLLQ